MQIEESLGINSGNSIFAHSVYGNLVLFLGVFDEFKGVQVIFNLHDSLLSGNFVLVPNTREYILLFSLDLATFFI